MRNSAICSETRSKHEDNYRRCQHKNRHVRETTFGDIGVNVIGHTRQEKEYAHRQKDSERRKQRGDLGDDQAKTEYRQ